MKAVTPAGGRSFDFRRLILARELWLVLVAGGLTIAALLARAGSAPGPGFEGGRAQAAPTRSARSFGDAPTDERAAEPGKMPEPLTQQRLIRDLRMAEGVDEGQAGPRLAAFVDPACGYCSQLHAQTRDLVAQGRLRLRWLPVAITGVDSLAEAAAILQSADRARALQQAYAQSTTGNAVGRISAGVMAPDQALAAVRANTRLLTQITEGRPMTPVLILETPEGNLRGSPGLPDNLEQFVQGNLR